MHDMSDPPLSSGLARVALKRHGAPSKGGNYVSLPNGFEKVLPGAEVGGCL
jgi:hypothetical protein